MEYYKNKEKEKISYTIDWFTLEFGLWLTKEQWVELEEATKALGSRCSKVDAGHSRKRQGKYHDVSWYQFDDLHVQFYADGPVFDLNFNPNSLHLNGNQSAVVLLRWLLSYLATCAGLYSVRVKRTDYALDVPCRYEELYVWSRKDEAHVKTTRYYGNRKATGALRVYDKTLERQQKKMPISEQITRCEWIQKNEMPFTYDLVGNMDFSSLKDDLTLVSFVPPEHFNEAMRRLAWKSKKLIKETCFKTIEVDTKLFDELLAEYSAEYRLAELRLVSLQNRLSDASLPSVEEDAPDDEESACSAW